MTVVNYKGIVTILYANIKWLQWHLFYYWIRSLYLRDYCTSCGYGLILIRPYVSILFKNMLLT